MIAAAVTVLSTSAYAASFWSRDLGALARELRDSRTHDETYEFFAELLALLDCDRLPPLAHPSPERELLRLEEARRDRLLSATPRTGTLWDDVTRPHSFRRDTRLAMEDGPFIRWPLEDERWSDETLTLDAPRSSCATPRQPSSDELAIATPALIQALRTEGDDAAASRVALERAILLMRANEVDEAREAASLIASGPLAPDERAVAVALRAGLGVDPPDTWLTLDPDAVPQAIEPLVRVRRAHRLAELGRWDDVLAATAILSDESPRDPAHDALRLLRARALVQSHRTLEAASLALDRLTKNMDDREWRQLAMDLATRLPPSTASLSLIERAGSDDELAARTMQVVGRMLAEARTDDAAQLLAMLDRTRLEDAALAHWFALDAEVAIARGATPRFERDLTELFGSKFEKTESLRRTRDTLALWLAQNVVTTWSASGDERVRRVLLRRLTTVSDAIDPALAPGIQELVDVLERRRAPPIIELSFPAGPVPLDDTPLDIRWPEPYSLLAIPAPGGRARAWFPSDATHLAPGGRTR